MVPAKKEQDIKFQIAENFDGVDVKVPKLKKLVKSVCLRFHLAKATVSIAIVNDAEIRRLNKQFLCRDVTTDCLSFDLSDEEHGSSKGGSGGGQEKNVPGQSCSAGKIFELVVNGEMAAKEANMRGHPGEAELALYVVHGLLHNLGFDDATEAGAKEMHETEDEILQELGYGLVYNKSTRA
ncbi:MAG: rRNA maturation RNase YbeY [Planctomycetota bacterium]|jgi:probable rRNA maturation factor